MKVLFIAAAISLPFLFGCATYPQSREEQAAYHANLAMDFFSKGDTLRAAYQIDAALTRPTGDKRIKDLFNTTPKARDAYFAYFENRIAKIRSADEAVAVFEDLKVVDTAGIFFEKDMLEFFAKLNTTVLACNQSGAIPFDLSDKLDKFPDLKSAGNQKIIVERTIKNLQTSASGKRPVGALMDFVQRVGTESVEGKRIESLLPTFNINRYELDAVNRVFPTFATARKNELTVYASLQVKNGDRLFSDDLLRALHNDLRGIEWVTAPNPKAITVVIERVRHDERNFPERSQTVTYAQHEVNLLGAALFMPRNASYLYEIVSGGSEIEYGYVILAIKDGKTIHDKVVRGKVGGEYRRCQNARIQNVFGGVTSAGFVANDDMQFRCNGPSPISIEDLRKEVLTKIVSGVQIVPPIKAVHDAN